MATCPKRKIISSTSPLPRKRRGGRSAISTLECGHITETDGNERRSGKAYCWDCHYGKPVDFMAECVLSDYGLTPNRS